MRATMPGRGNLIVVPLAISGCLLCLALNVVLFDPLSIVSNFIGVVRLRRELPRAIERWESQGVSEYQIRVKGAVPLACLLDGELTVRGDQLVQVRMRENAFVPETPLQIISPSDWDTSGCSFPDLTIDAMFDRVDSSLQEAGVFGAPLTVHFDDATGYITEYRIGSSAGGGIFAPRVSDCCTWFEFSDLSIQSQ